MKKVIVDADQIPYSCGFAAKGEPLSHVLQLAKKAMQRIQTETGVDDLEVYIKGVGNFREEIAFTQTYKGTRSAAKPETYDDTRDYLKEQWGGQPVHGMEADDRVSIILWEDFVKHGGDKDKCEVILSSPDKDLRNTPGWHHFPKQGTVEWITPYAAEMHFFKQMLEGDSVDNIKGLPKVAMSDIHTYGLTKQANSKGCGKASALKLISHTAASADPDLFTWERYMTWGKEVGMAPEDVRDYFIEQAQLLWMTRELDSLGNPVLYSPNEDKYEEAAERIYGAGSYASYKTGDGGEDLFVSGGGTGSSGEELAGGDDDEWLAICPSGS